MNISVCIATYKRPTLLRETLKALGEQIVAPAEVVISDASPDNDSQAVVESFQREEHRFPIKYVRTERPALPWQRYWAFQHAAGDIVLFIDDDIVLISRAVSAVLAVFHADRMNEVAGVGFVVQGEQAIPGGAERSLGYQIKKRWLGLQGVPGGRISDGGITTELTLCLGESGRLRDVEWLCGGGMAYRRRVLEQIGRLDALYELYDRRIGRGEDAVLSAMASAYGKLVLLPEVLGIHRSDGASVAAYATGGYKAGLCGTWGRACVMRWLARDYEAYRATLKRYVALELARGVWQLIKQPWSVAAWTRLAGWTVGVWRIATKLNQIPEYPGQRESGMA